MITRRWWPVLWAWACACAVAFSVFVWSLASASDITNEYECMTVVPDVAAAQLCGLLAGGLVLGRMTRVRSGSAVLIGCALVSGALGVWSRTYVYSDAIAAQVRAAYAFVPVLGLPAGVSLGRALEVGVGTSPKGAPWLVLAQVFRLLLGFSALFAGCVHTATGAFTYSVTYWIWPMPVGILSALVGCYMLRIRRVVRPEPAGEAVGT